MQQNRLCRARTVQRHVRRARAHHVRWWAWLTGFITIMVSIAALVVSYLAYQDQHESDAAAFAASEQQYAAQVSFWISLGNGKGLPVVVVQNRGAAPISDVSVSVEQSSPSSYPGAVIATSLALGLIPPCSVSSTTMTRRQTELWVGFGRSKPTAAEFFDEASVFPGFQEYMYFTDASGQYWERTGTGRLYRLAKPGSPVWPPGATYEPGEVDLSSRFATATACS